MEKRHEYFEVTWGTVVWRSPLLVLKSPLHGGVVELAKYRITQSPHLPIYIQDAINMLIDMNRLLGADIDHALFEARALQRNSLVAGRRFPNWNSKLAKCIPRKDRHVLLEGTTIYSGCQEDHLDGLCGRNLHRRSAT